MNTEKQTPSDAVFDDAFRFIVKLGTLTHGYGPNALRLESFLSAVTESLGYRGSFRSTPTEMVFAVSKKDTSHQRIHYETMQGTGLELTRLAKVGELVDTLAAGNISISEATKRLDDIENTPRPWGNIANGLSYACIGAAFAVLLSGGWTDVLFSGIFSLVVFGMVTLSGRFGMRAAVWLPLSSAFIAGILTAFTKVFLPEINYTLVTLAAILVLVPGYSISVGVIELVSNRVVSGTANLMSGLVYLMKQFMGAWLGVGVVGVFCQIPSNAAVPVQPFWVWVFMPLIIAGLCVVFQTAPRDFVWAFFGSLIAYGGILLGNAVAGGNLGNLIGTIIAVVYANLWGRITGRPTSIVLLPAIVLLVSGSIGFRGLTAMATGQTATGEQQFIQMFIVALTIAAGLLVGNTIVRPKVTL